MRQFWDAVLARFTVYIESAKPPDRPVAEASFALVKLERRTATVGAQARKFRNSGKSTSRGENKMKSLIQPSIVLLWILLSSSAIADDSKAVGATAQGQPFGLLTEIPPEKQIELAMSAAPAEIAAKATVLVLGPNGYVQARTGSNGFTCLVERQYFNTVEPSCYDAEGSATTLQARLYLEELRSAKVPEDEIEKRINERYKTGVFKAPQKPGFVYMLSAHAWVLNDRTNKIVNAPPHLMFYAPYATQKDFGEFVGRHVPYVVLEGRPDAYLIVNPGPMASALQKRSESDRPSAEGHVPGSRAAPK